MLQNIDIYGLLCYVYIIKTIRLKTKNDINKHECFKFGIIVCLKLLILKFRLSEYMAVKYFNL